MAKSDHPYLGVGGLIEGHLAAQSVRGLVTEGTLMFEARLLGQLLAKNLRLPFHLSLSATQAAAM